MQKKHEKIIKAVVADNESKRLRITFEDGTKGQLTYKQLEAFYGMFYLPDMGMPLPDNNKGVAHNEINNEGGTVINRSSYFQLPSYNKGFLGLID